MAWIAVKKRKHARFVRNSDWNYLRILVEIPINFQLEKQMAIVDFFTTQEAERIRY